MAKRFTRNIRSIEDIEKQPKYTNEQNDLLSDDKEVYIRNQGKYEKITGNVEKVNNKEPDDNGNVEIDTGAMTVNDEKPDDSGNVEIDTGVMQVNGKEPDEQGNIEVGSGVKTVTNVAPDENGNVDLQLKDFTGQEKLVRKNQLDKALEGIESGYKNYTDNAVEGFNEMFDNKRSTYTEVFYRHDPPVISGTTITFKGNMRLYRYSRALGKWTKRLTVSNNLQDGETEQTFRWAHNTVIVWNLDDNTLVREVYPTKIDYNAITLFRNIEGKLVSGALLAQYKTEMLSRQRLDINGVIEKDIGRPIQINNISQGRSAPNGAVVVGNEYWAFYASDDGHVNYNICDRFLINDDYTFTHLGSFEHNWGHCNSLDYCEATDTLILGNGSGDYTLSGKIFIIENVQALKENTQNTLADIATIIDVGMGYGAKVNVIWGDSNAGNYNVAHIISNDNKKITRIVLGRTDGHFDGSFVELKQYEQADGLDVVQGAVYGNDGYVYVGLGHAGAWYAKQRLQKDGKIGVESAREIFYDENGDVLAGFTESISMYQDKLLLRTTTNGGEVYVLYK